MHNAPAVSFPVGRSHFQGGLLGLLVGLGFLAVAIWTFESDIPGWRHWMAACSCVVISVWVGCSWWHTAIGSFSWDGVAWHWTVGAQSVRVLPETMLDLQSTLLLRLHVDENKGIAWVWLDRTSSPSRWMAMRRAIYCRARPGDEPLADTADTPLATRMR